MSKREFGIITEEKPERAVLVGIDRGDASWPLAESLAELERLAQTAGARVVGSISQKLDAPNPRTFIGQGKAEELVCIVRNLDADLVIVDDELSPSQQGNLEKMVGAPVKVIDRTALILDIFALHASSKEGRLQVRLAQNQYLYPRLRGMWAHLASNRMGGGVGSRFGEGESQLEVDRRLVRKRIARIKRELAELAKSRSTQRKLRKQSGVFRVTLAGYTNAGKSSLMNKLTGAQVLAYDELFATLDSTTRKLELPQCHGVTITDTVGFIQKLPHNLVEAFHSTLDEVREADLILIVVDVSSSQRDPELAAVREVLGEIEADKLPALTVFNKTDLMRGERASELEHLRELHPGSLFVSAKTGDGMENLITAITQQVIEANPEIETLIPYSRGDLVALAHEKAEVISERYDDQGTVMRMRVPKARLPLFEQAGLIVSSTTSPQ